MTKLTQPQQAFADAPEAAVAQLSPVTTEQLSAQGVLLHTTRISYGTMGIAFSVLLDQEPRLATSLQAAEKTA